jgi:hypothetical protein
VKNNKTLLTGKKNVLYPNKEVMGDRQSLPWYFFLDGSGIERIYYCFLRVDGS